MLKATILHALFLGSLTAFAASTVGLAQGGNSPFPRVGVAGIAPPARPEIEAVTDRVAFRGWNYLGQPEHRRLRNTLIAGAAGLVAGAYIGSTLEPKPVTYIEDTFLFGPTEKCRAHCQPGAKALWLGIGGMLAGGTLGLRLTRDGRFGVQ